jgi:hypothetical protein
MIIIIIIRNYVWVLLNFVTLSKTNILSFFKGYVTRKIL